MSHPDEIIEQAARVLRNRWSCNTPPTAENVADAQALAVAGLLADAKLRQDANTLARQLGKAVRARDDRQARIDAIRDQLVARKRALESATTYRNERQLVDTLLAALTGGAG